jgi:hypothetical protein
MSSKPISQSPTPAVPLSESPTPILMDFPTAIRAVIEGKSITRLDWNDNEIYCALRNSFLEISYDMKTKFYKWCTWIVSEGDLLGTDWVVVTHD